jgi:hypothetical protein
MSFWRLKDYWPQPGENLVQEWYDKQIDDEVRAEFDYVLSMFAATQDLENIPEFRPLKKKYAGLCEIVIDVKLPHEKKKRHYGVIGIWQPDSSDFILLLVSEKNGKTYNPPLQDALTLKADWEDKKKGKIYDHLT